VAAHLTCVGQSRSDVGEVLDRYAWLGVDHIVALRGDPPGGIDAPYEPHPDGFGSTAELVGAIKARGDITVSVSAYPERHPQSPTDDHDLDVLAAKVDAGADRAMTQMFFSNDYFVAYLDRVRERGIDIPVVPGIFPIHSLPAVSRFAGRCGATIPAELAARFDGLEDDPVGATRVAADVAAAQIRDLAAAGTRQVHLYTLNRAELALDVCDRLALVTA
jgi:methylenetetrahydrofolate reductase (NADPH)